MKWYSPIDGAKRTRLKFLWLPTQCRDGFTRWLEVVEVLEEYRNSWTWCGWVIIDTKEAK
jgi:hypothetical protein